jgi:hypothetical protein
MCRSDTLGKRAVRSEHPRAMKPTSSAGLVAPLSLLVAAICVLVASCNRSVSGDFDRGAAYLGLGDDCNNDVECASHSCKQAMCAPPPAGIVPIDGDCSGGQECVDDAYCDTDICVPMDFACAAWGTPCLVDEDCCGEPCDGYVCGYQY